MDLGDFLVSPTGRALIILFRMIFGSVMYCFAMDCLGIKRFGKFLTFQRVLGLFLFLFSLRILIGSIVFPMVG